MIGGDFPPNNLLCRYTRQLVGAEELAVDDYATPQRLAMYLEAGWSDYLLAPLDRNPVPHNGMSPSPLNEYVKLAFFQTAATLAWSWANAISLNVVSVCDIGGGTGRGIFELERQFPRSNRLVLVEPSHTFCEWAELLLASQEPLPDLPLVNSAAGPKMVPANSRPPPIARASSRLTVLNAGLEDCSDLRGFDLVQCHNVVDRHQRPQDIVPLVGNMMNPGGLFILSSPLDFHEHSTPDIECWIEDLKSLFDDSWEHVGEDELFYEFRFFNRNWTRFCSQVVGRRWIAT